MTRGRALTEPGTTYGSWTVVAEVTSIEHRRRAFFLRCKCGNEGFVVKHVVTGGQSTSCGCVQRALTSERCTTHGARAQRQFTREWVAWAGIVSRCTNVNRRNYCDYGGRGIRMCDEWRESFEAFLAYVGKAPSPKHSIDRIDNDGNYEPGNVRWSTPREQAANGRSNLRITAFGETMILADWARRTGLTSSLINSRLGRGWSPERAMTPYKPDAKEGVA